MVLTDDLGVCWSISYYTLLAAGQVADGRNGLGNQKPRTIGSSASGLMHKIDGSHHDVALTPDQWRTIWLWLESGAPYAGTYAALRNAEDQAREGSSTLRVWVAGAEPAMPAMSCPGKASPSAASGDVGAGTDRNSKDPAAGPLRTHCPPGGPSFFRTCAAEPVSPGVFAPVAGPAAEIGGGLGQLPASV